MHNFNRWIYSLIKEFLGQRVLEIGCGVGSFTGLLSEGGRRVMAVDIEPAYVKKAREGFQNNELVEAIVFDATEKPGPEILNFQADTVVCMNVIEHLKDDAAAMEYLAASLQPEGRAIILVPAFQWLYGSMDESYRHWRRYNRKELEKLLQQAGLKVEKTFYVNLFGMLGWWMSGKVLRRRVLPSGGLRLYHWLVPLFKWVEKITGPPVGLSLISIGRKPVARK
jgi:SAM-dependent methyltransferase